MSSSGRRHLRLATFNVHSFFDAGGRDNMDRVKKLIRDHKVDVLCMQESGRRKVRYLFDSLSSMKGIASRGGCSIISKFPLRQNDCHGNRRKRFWPRYVNADILLDLDNVINITCIHLTHRKETTRMPEWIAIHTDLFNYVGPEVPQLLCGDFNALTPDDYTEDELDAVATVRRNNKWESPKRGVTDKIKAAGYKDAYDITPNFNGPLSTCRFNTRIDYFYLGPAFNHAYNVKQVYHVDDRASDHNMVVMEIEVAKN